MTGSLPDLGRKWVGEPDFIDCTSLFPGRNTSFTNQTLVFISSHISDQSDFLVYIFSPQCDKCGKVGTCIGFAVIVVFDDIVKPLHNGASNEIKEIKVCKKCPKVKPYCAPIFDPIMFKSFLDDA